MRLPPDNFPDDTETYAFHQYRAKSFRWRRWGMMVGGGIGLLVGVVGIGWLLMQYLPSKSAASPTSPHYITPTPDISQTRPEGFPVDVLSTQVIQIPSRIDEVGVGRRGYIFQPNRELVWCVATFGATAQLYGMNDAVAAECIQGEATTELLVKFTAHTVYGLVVETTDVESVLFILPIE